MACVIRKPEVIRLVLIGKTGSGKSRTGNSILNFAPNSTEGFPYALDASSVTTITEMKTDVRLGFKIDVIDTPGVFDTKKKNEEIQDEIKRCLVLSEPGPHAILMCVQMGRFTKEDIETAKHYLKHFGVELYKFVIIVFTKFDLWLQDKEDQGVMDPDPQTYIDGLDKEFRKFIFMCDSRYIFFNNRKKCEEADAQVKELLEHIEAMIRMNGEEYYTDKNYKEASRLVDKEKSIRMNRKQYHTVDNYKEASRLLVKEDLKNDNDAVSKVSASLKNIVPTLLDFLNPFKMRLTC